ALAIHHHQRLCLAQDEAVRDGLTRLYNHAFFRRSLKLAYDLWQRYQRPFAVIMLDLDSFKGTNDRFGHLTGDAVLAAVGRQIADTTRTVDVPARYGGDEFAVILTDTAYTGAITLAGRLGRAIGALGLPGVDPVGVSIGVTVVGPSDRHGIDVLQRADMALLQAKAQGKNRICGKPIGDMSPPGHQAGSREQPTQVWPECPAALDQAEPAKTVSPPSLAASWLP
ncbi:MAG: GGDEF domain-containing protein, partial [Candidatus Sericytochromatia bacterium]|nr:GGDEF domain-containing protein [Candidatus Sericytochromatia bacterium]